MTRFTLLNSRTVLKCTEMRVRVEKRSVLGWNKSKIRALNFAKIAPKFSILQKIIEIYILYIWLVLMGWSSTFEFCPNQGYRSNLISFHRLKYISSGCFGRARLTTSKMKIINFSLILVNYSKFDILK